MCICNIFWFFSVFLLGKYLTSQLGFLTLESQKFTGATGNHIPLLFLCSLVHVYKLTTLFLTLHPFPSLLFLVIIHFIAVVPVQKFSGMLIGVLCFPFSDGSSSKLNSVPILQIQLLLVLCNRLLSSPSEYHLYCSANYLCLYKNE